MLTHTTRPFFVALDEGEDIDVLRFDATGGVDHEDADVGGFDGSDGTYYGVVFDVLVDFVLFAYAGCVDEIEVEAELVVARVDAVASGSGNVGDDVALLADEGVDDRGFAGVGTAHDGKLGYVLEVLRFVLVERRELADYVVEEVAGA